MQLRHKALRSAVATFAAILAVSIMALAQDGAGRSQKGISIKNFGQVDECFYRGAQPKEEEFRELAALGIRTVIDLRADPKDYEKRVVESLGMRYVNIPMEAKEYPRQEWVDAFLKVVNDPQTGKFYVHCAGGRHRTGAMGAVYRYTKYGWSYEQVYAEMKKFDFYTSWGHADYKKFVEDFWQRMQESKASAKVEQAKPPVAAAAPIKIATTSVTVNAIPTTDSIANQK